MRRCRFWEIVRAMGGDRGGAPDHAPVIQVELRLEGLMPTGAATGSGGAVRGFTGWVGLMAAVDALAGREEGMLTGEDLR